MIQRPRCFRRGIYVTLSLRRLGFRPLQFLKLLDQSRVVPNGQLARAGLSGHGNWDAGPLLRPRAVRRGIRVARLREVLAPWAPPQPVDKPGPVHNAAGYFFERSACRPKAPENCFDSFLFMTMSWCVFLPAWDDLVGVQTAVAADTASVFTSCTFRCSTGGRNIST
jgi:hypothetical protein